MTEEQYLALTADISAAEVRLGATLPESWKTALLCTKLAAANGLVSDDVFFDPTELDTLVGRDTFGPLPVLSQLPEPEWVYPQHRVAAAERSLVIPFAVAAGNYFAFAFEGASDDAPSVVTLRPRALLDRGDADFRPKSWGDFDEWLADLRDMPSFSALPVGFTRNVEATRQVLLLGTWSSAEPEAALLPAKWPNTQMAPSLRWMVGDRERIAVEVERGWGAGFASNLIVSNFDRFLFSQGGGLLLLHQTTDQGTTCIMAAGDKHATRELTRRLVPADQEAVLAIEAPGRALVVGVPAHRQQFARQVRVVARPSLATIWEILAVLARRHLDVRGAVELDDVQFGATSGKANRVSVAFRVGAAKLQAELAVQFQHREGPAENCYGSDVVRIPVVIELLRISAGAADRSEADPNIPSGSDLNSDNESANEVVHFLAALPDSELVARPGMGRLM